MGLSPRQVDRRDQLLSLWREGHTSSHIAEILGIEPSTVICTVKRYRKKNDDRAVKRVLGKWNLGRYGQRYWRVVALLPKNTSKEICEIMGLSKDMFNYHRKKAIERGHFRPKGE